MSAANTQSAWKALGKGLLDALLLFVAFAVSLNLRHILGIGYTDSHGIENMWSFIPESNYPVLLAIVLSTLVIFWVLKKIRSSNPAFFRAAVIGLLLFSYFIGTTSPLVASFENKIDTFHHGEQLAPALAFDQGKKPYENLFFLRGAGEDVIVPWLSFRLFGQSIGSYYFLVGMLQLVTTGVFLFLLSKLFKKDLAFLVVALWFLLSAYAAFYHIRDLPVWISLLLILSVLGSDRLRPYKLAGLGVLASLSLFYSVDRGTFLTALLALFLSVLLVFKQRGGYLTFHMKTVRQRLPLIGPAIGGYAGGLLLALVALGGSGFAAFLKTSFGEVARYQGAIFNSPYPPFAPGTFVDWLPVMALVVMALVVIKTIRAEWPKITTSSMFEMILLVLGVIFFRAATGRPDLGHVAYGSVVLFVALFVIGFRRLDDVLENWPGKASWNTLTAALPVFIVLAFAFSPAIVSYYRLTDMNQMSLPAIKTFLTSPSKPDSFWMDGRDEQVTQAIKQAAGNKGDLFVFSSEPFFYYSTQMPNPTRYSISWFADPKPLENEMLKDLEAKPPTVILYQSGRLFNDSPDYISMKKRLPEVNQWILDHYHHKQTVQGAILLTP